MKKPYSLLLTVTFGVLVFINKPVTLSAQGNGNWLNYWQVDDTVAFEEYGGTPIAYFAYLFPDSSELLCDFGNNTNCVNPNIHIIGNILDPSSENMQAYFGYSYSKFVPYWVDSISIAYSYMRNTGPGIVDTLIAYLWNNTVSTDIDTLSYIMGNVTVEFGLLPYDSTGTNLPNVKGALKIFKIPLTLDDTASFGSTIRTRIINSNHFSVPPGEIVASAFAFKPGYSYLTSDTISQSKNVFAFISHEPDGDDYYPTYSPGGERNLSLLVENSVRYNFDTLGYNGYFIPTYMLQNILPECLVLVNHVISYYVSGFGTLPCAASFTIDADTSQLHHYIVTNYSFGKGSLSYDWNWGDGTHDTIPYPSHTYANSGFYDICLSITDSTGCTSTYCDSSFYIMRTTNTMVYINVVAPLNTGTKEISLQSPLVMIYPNPAGKELRIKSTSFKINEVEIYNLLGESATLPTLLKLKGGDALIDVSMLPAGIYFVRASNKSNSWVGKFVKE